MGISYKRSTIWIIYRRMFDTWRKGLYVARIGKRRRCYSR
nr:MAG TPA: hypothetical protein [Bacteriophage sp.]